MRELYPATSLATSHDIASDRYFKTSIKQILSVLFFWSSAAMGLPRRRHALVMLRPVLARCGASTLATECSGRIRAQLFNEIVGQGERRSEVFTAMSCAILRKVGNGFEGEVRIFDQIAEGEQRVPIDWHDSIVGPSEWKSKR